VWGLTFKAYYAVIVWGGGILEELLAIEIWRVTIRKAFFIGGGGLLSVFFKTVCNNSLFVWLFKECTGYVKPLLIKQMLFYLTTSEY